MNPTDKGFYMPAEWTEHDCCWMAWPCREGLWGNSGAVAREYADVAHAIARFEPVNMLVPPRLMASARNLLGGDVDMIEMPIDDSWARDSGPNFLVNEAGELAGSTWKFNAWGEKYQPYDQDALMGSRILQHVGVQQFTSRLVAEGGGITVDGEGTVITTETCLLNANRNPDWSKQQVEQELCRTLGAQKVIWLPGDPFEDETNGHVDGIAAFIGPGKVLFELIDLEDDDYFPVMQKNLDALKGETDAQGRKLKIEFIQSGDYAHARSDKDCKSYINAYLANSAVIVPGYGDPEDPRAIDEWKNVYPDREVVQVQVGQIALGGGAIHCITQQQPSTS